MSLFFPYWESDLHHKKIDKTNMETQNQENNEEPKKKRGYIFSRKPRNQEKTTNKQNCLLKQIAAGNSINESSKFCKCSAVSYHRWKKYDDVFGKKIDEQFQLKLELAEELLMNQMKDDPNLLQFFLKHRHTEYKQKQSIELNHKGLDEIVVKVILPEEYQAEQKPTTV